MKAKYIRALLFTLLSISAIGCISTKRQYFTIDDLAGTTWVNTEYKSQWVKIIVTNSSTMGLYGSSAAEKPEWIDKYEITDSWYKGADLWFKYKCSAHAEVESNLNYYGLSRISKNGTVWENCRRGSGYPTALDPLEGELWIHYRQ
jgi:hypothetical protein